MATFYGSDTACLGDVGLVDVLVTDPMRLIGERISRRLTTPKGALGLIGGDPGAGLDVRQWVNAKLGPSDVGTIQRLIEAEVRKDEQVDDVTATVNQTAGRLTVRLALTTSTGPFTLTLNVNQLSADLVYG